MTTTPVVSNASPNAKALFSVAALPVGALVGFKALPSWSKEPLEPYYKVLTHKAQCFPSLSKPTTSAESTSGTSLGLGGAAPQRHAPTAASLSGHNSEGKEPEPGLSDWSGIYSQVSLRRAVAYLSNQWERGETQAQVSALYYTGERTVADTSAAVSGSCQRGGASTSPLVVLVCRDPRIGDGRVAWPEKSTLLRRELWAHRDDIIHGILQARRCKTGIVSAEKTDLSSQEEEAALRWGLQQLCQPSSVSEGPATRDHDDADGARVVAMPLVQGIGEYLGAALYLPDHTTDRIEDNTGESVARTTQGRAGGPSRQRGKDISYELVLPHCLMRRFEARTLVRCQPRHDMPLLTGAVHVRASGLHTNAVEGDGTLNEEGFVPLRCRPAVAADPESLADALTSDGVLGGHPTHVAEFLLWE